ncbi:predicted protein [Scheffersomyces stipitis CBS 6054]|uniref:Uncharacterized protein n=1 Tax=Scheffersomyces stipitis (strain ATCC 58785 / CBS 6054 / NBRC 10063 / NRRL Y-11545) TaxID=322104 RepID=A3LRW0_PICST|nr:predicted protein [Scheffersomyces stipitis CBS 6054]ABN65798.2 predicted protein [Scheffersomyces stipitis CBS 6054]
MKFFIYTSLILLVSRCRADLPVELKDFKMVPRKALDSNKIIRIPSLDEDTDLSYFDNIDNVIVIEDTGTLVVNKHKLNTAERTGGNMFAFFPDFKPDKTTWYEFKPGKSDTVLGPRLPLSGCLNSNFGDGGSLGGSISTTFGKTATLDFPWVWDLAGMVSVNLDWSPEVVSSVSYSGSYSCNIGKGETGQVFIQPFFIEVGNPQSRTIKINRGRTFTSPFSKKPTHLEIGEWGHLGKKIRLNSPFAMPIFTCTTDPRYLACGANILGDSYAF